MELTRSPREIRRYIDAMRARVDVCSSVSAVEWLEYGYDFRDGDAYGWQATAADTCRQGFASMKDSDCTCPAFPGGHIVGTREYGGQLSLNWWSYPPIDMAIKPPLRCPA